MTDAEFFYAKFVSGVGLEAGSPILALRERLRVIKTNRTRIRTGARYSLVFRAWNAWRVGKQLTTLPLTPQSAPTDPS